MEGIRCLPPEGKAGTVPVRKDLGSPSSDSSPEIQASSPGYLCEALWELRPILLCDYCCNKLSFISDPGASGAQQLSQGLIG